MATETTKTVSPVAMLNLIIAENSADSELALEVLIALDRVRATHRRRHDSVRQPTTH